MTSLDFLLGKIFFPEVFIDFTADDCSSPRWNESHRRILHFREEKNRKLELEIRKNV